MPRAHEGATFDRVISIGSNFFFGVPFPVAVGNRYVHLSADPGGGLTPLVRVFRWDAETRSVTEETADETSPLTWSHDAENGTVRLRVDPERASILDGYVAGGPLDSVSLVIRSDSIDVLNGDIVVATFGSNYITGVDVGILVDPAHGSTSVGVRLPDGFVFRLRHEDAVVRIANLVDPRLGAALLQSQEFHRCSILGPAVLALRGHNTIGNCRFNLQGAQADSLVWPLPPSGETYGAIAVENIEFMNCDFQQVAFMVPADQRQAFLDRLAGGEG